jgi:TATA-box binding protein (TBP) (component of TFIID and TFIIIB)
LIFSTGKIVIAGGKSDSQVYEAFQVMKRVVSKITEEICG